MAIYLFRLSSRPGCSMLEIWDVEDPSNAANPPLCSVLLKNAKPYFTTVFQNSMYRVLKINWEQDYPSFCAKMSKLNTSSPATIKITSFPKRHFQRRYNYLKLLVTKDKLLHCFTSTVSLPSLPHNWFKTSHTSSTNVNFRVLRKCVCKITIQFKKPRINNSFSTQLDALLPVSLELTNQPRPSEPGRLCADSEKPEGGGSLNSHVLWAY